MAVLNKGLLVILAALAVVAFATTSADTARMFREQEQLESFEEFAPLDHDSARLLDRELQAEDIALTELGVDLDSAYRSASLAATEERMAAQLDMDADADIQADAEADADAESGADPIVYAVPVYAHHPQPEPLKNATVAKIIDPNPPRVPVVISHPSGLRTVVSADLANQLLTRLYDRNPITVDGVAQQLPQSARVALYRVLRKSNSTDVRVAICASFLAAFTTDNIAMEAEAQEKSAALLEASDEKTALANTEAHEENRAATEASLVEMAETAEKSHDQPQQAQNQPPATNPPAAAAGGVVAANPQVAGQLDQNAHQLDTGVSALGKYADVLESEALVLSKKLEELARLHKGSIFKAMDRGPVGRRPTDKSRIQVFTNSVRSWEAEATNNAMRGRPVAQNEADRIFTVEPIPK